MTLFHTPHREVNYQKVKINNISVEIVDEFKFLGIFIDKHLKWSSHTEFIDNKIPTYIGVINRLKHTLPQRLYLHYITNSSFTFKLRACTLGTSN